MKKILTSLLMVIIVCSVAVAGLQRSGGKTKWVSHPTAATCFLRDRTDDVYPSRDTIVYPDTTKLLDVNTVGTGTVYNTGYFNIDTSGDVYPIDNLKNRYAQLGDRGALLDIEFLLDSSGDVYPRD